MPESQRASSQTEGHNDPVETLPQLPGPHRPRSSKARYFGHLTDVILVLVAIGFIVFSLIVLTSDNRPMTEGSQEKTLLLAASYGPTIFPIIFAAIVGRTLKSLATWDLQRGTTIGRVEQFLGSNTIVGSIVTQFELRTYGPIALSIIALWALSPLGSQATLRIAYVETRAVESQHEITLMNHDSAYLVGEGLSGTQSVLSKSLFSSSLVSTKVRSGLTQDTWGGLRIPMIEAFDNHSSGDWIDLSANPSAPVFSSLVGMQYSPASPPGMTAFTVNTSYLSLDCPVFTQYPRDQNLGYIKTNFSDPQTAPALQNKENYWYSSSVTDVTGQSAVPNGFQIAVSACLGGCAALSPGDTRKPREARRVVWESISESGTDHIDCSLHTTYVDVNYTCPTPSDCHATGVRLSASQPQPSIFATKYNKEAAELNDPWNARNFTRLDRTILRNIDGTDAEILIQLLAGYFPLQGSSDTNPIIGYLVSPNESYTPPVPYFWPGMASLGRKTFETRLAQILNTQFIVGIDPQVSLGVEAVGSPDQHFNLLSTTATTTVEKKFFVCNKVWFSAVFIISTIVLMVAAAGAILRRLTVVPDVLGTLSVTTLDNRCERLAKSGSMLGGLERARYLKAVSIKLGDVEPSLPVGRIALAAPLCDVTVDNVESWREYE
ncbi:hypothetical protein ANO14919_034860 [Xylariales sp. No.14919]|nr:hypothetical protein ANO14919_034860 [Xylariales sp. No.14919]